MFDHFGFLAPFYENFIKPKSPEQLINLLNLPSSGTLLDIGGGTGRVSSFLIDQVDRVIIADPSEKMLLQSQEKAGLEPICSYAEKLPFPDDHFERLIMVDAMHHVCDQAVTARELWRVLKPGGLLLIEEPDIKNWGVKLVAVAEKIALMRSHFLAPEQIQELFQPFDPKIEIHRDGYISWVVIHK